MSGSGQDPRPGRVGGSGGQDPAPAPAQGPRHRLRARFRRIYGESPLHLALLAASFAVCGYAALRWLPYDWFSIGVWFVGAAVLHDLVLVPLYAGVDWALHRAFGTAADSAPRGAVNHVRVPAFVSLLLLLVYWPLILRDSPHYTVSTRLSDTVFLGRWLLITAALFTASALWYAAGLWRAHRRAHTSGKER
ncbi:hypothetical protein AB0910_04840 [Streptomyces sp. NPDC047002]|uniref:hypothetical protein n=1 Tax=Streptomyces sp. NPDC047002 TaxID=3155475 RepID=UPI003453264A